MRPGISAAASGGFRDHWIPWLFVGFFGVVLVVNGILAYVAVSSFTGLQTEGHYRKGLAYNRVLESSRRQAALGWSIRIEFEQAGDRNGRLAVRALDKAGAPLDGASVAARLVRPTQSGYDFDVTLNPAGAGWYEAELALPLRGQWDIQTQIEHPSGTFRTVERIVTK